ncbi:MAG: anti-sigma factor [Proteobacteria bacterium]|nr:anti-sigma factor [Pseudomonadota bacterium]
MDCPTCESMVEVYLDGELSAAEAVAFEQALDRCPDCRRRLEEARALSRLLRDLPAEPAPDLVRARVERDLRAAARPVAAGRRGSLRWMATAASLLVAASLGWMGGMLTTQQGREADELVSGYLRVASSEHPVDVVSSDRHTVKPWFAGRIDYAPPVYDLTTSGFPLLGGRVDIHDSRKVAVLVYGHNQHKVALTLWPAAEGNGTPVEMSRRNGFVLAQWRHGGFEMRAASDVQPTDMEAFAKAIDDAIDNDR